MRGSKYKRYGKSKRNYRSKRKGTRISKYGSSRGGIRFDQKRGSYEPLINYDLYASYQVRGRIHCPVRQVYGV